MCVPRLLKAMGWQEYPENDDNFLPLTEDELREFQTKTEQVGPTRVYSAGQEGRKSFMNPQTYLINLDILIWLLQSHWVFLIPLSELINFPHNDFNVFMQLKRNGMQRNGALPRARGVTLHFTPWRSVAEANVEEGSESETSSSSQTSDDDDCIRS